MGAMVKENLPARAVQGSISTSRRYTVARIGNDIVNLLEQNMTTFVRGALAACVLSLSSGCVAVIPYNPDATQVDKLGKDGAAARMREVLNRAVAPRVTAIDVADDFLWLQWQGTVP